MKQKIKYYFLNSMLLATSLMDFIKDIDQRAIDKDTGIPTGALNSAASIISASFHWLFIVAGFLSVIFVIYGGYTMIFSAGDTAKVESGKKMILWAIIGIVIVGLARVLVYFLIDRVIQPTGVTVPRY